MNSVNRNTVDELYQATVKKTEYLKRNGYNVVEMWECALKRELEEDKDMKHYFDHYHLTDPLEPRDALYGGRTNALKLYHRCERGRTELNTRFHQFVSSGQSIQNRTHGPSENHYRKL